MSVSGNVLAFDYGTRRIGVAVGQVLSRTATALTTLMVHSSGPDWERISELVQTWEPDAMVVGLPWYEDGSTLGGRYRCPVHTVDEHLSSHEAQARQRDGQAADLDAIAAQVILETWWSVQHAVASHAGRAHE
jgi:putative holliday junction resolvase